MTTFIPEWNKVFGRDLQLKRVLKDFDDSYVVRRPIKPELCPATFFLQHSTKGWLAVAVVETAFVHIDPTQLIAAQDHTGFDNRLRAMRHLGGDTAQSKPLVESLVVLWNCTADQVSVLTRYYLGRYGIRLVSRDSFTKLGTKLMDGQLVRLEQAAENSLMGTYFPEAEIAAISTTQRFISRDNSAKLGRFFLDIQQEWACKLDLDMPDDQSEAAADLTVRLINGVAGSGKTLIAINRALMLAKMYPQHKILILIHNTPVVADTNYRLRRIHERLPSNLEIATFGSWMAHQWKAVFGGFPTIQTDTKVLLSGVSYYRQNWPTLKQTDQQLLDEIEFIKLVPIVDEAAYLSANRAGRGFALQSDERKHLWQLYQTFSHELGKQDYRMWSDLARDVLLEENGMHRLARYHHVLVDEAQFFAPSAFHVIKQALNHEGQLFLCADPTQGFLKQRLSWKSVGLDVAGRTKKLRKSYRTTKAILQAANSVLVGLGQREADDYVAADLAEMRQGDRPRVIYSNAPQDCIDRVVNEVCEKHRNQNPTLGGMLVLYGESVDHGQLYQQLCQQLGFKNIWWFNRTLDDNKKTPPDGYSKEYLRMANVDTATGLEASVVFLVGVESLLKDREIKYLTMEEGVERAEENARKLYMAMTRAGQQLVLITTEEIPRTVAPYFDEAP
jgi:hypothetical protein